MDLEGRDTKYHRTSQKDGDDDTWNTDPRSETVDDGEHQDLDHETVTSDESLLSRIQIEDWWTLHISALVLSATLLIMVCALLHHYDGKPQPLWTLVSLNSLISWLSTFSKALVLFPVACCLGQLKWTWMADQPRALADLQSYDAASRGVTGSVQLLFSKRGRHMLQSIGCIATILSVAHGPSLQNLIHYYPKSVVDSAQQAYTTNGSSYATIKPFDSNVDPVLKANIYNSIFQSDPDERWATPQYLCSTSNCTFRPWITFAAQARCSDKTSQLQTTCQPCATNLTVSCSSKCEVVIADQVGERHLPGATRLSYLTNVRAKPCEPTDEDPKVCKYLGKLKQLDDEPLSNGISVSTVPRDSLSGSTRYSVWPLIRYIMVKDPKSFLGDNDEYRYLTNDTRLTAAECEIVFGLQAAQDKVVNSNYHTEDIGFWRYGDPPINRTANETYASSWWRDLITHAASLEGDREAYAWLLPNYREVNVAGAGIQTLISRVFSGRIRAAISQTVDGFGMEVNKDSPDAADSSDDAVYAIFTGKLPGCQPDADHLTCAAQNVAKAITKTFRDDAFIAYGTSDGNVTMGKAYIMKSYVQIDWWWISLPVCIWFMAYVILVGTVVRTRRARIPVWTNNILPLLYLYREEDLDECKEDGARFGTSSGGHWRKAKRSRVQLHVGKEKASFRSL